MKDILAKSLLKKIERLEAFEERLSVRFENISIKVDDDGWVYIFFELQTNKGTTIDNMINIECTLYDVDGQILEVDSKLVLPERFYGFQVFKFSFQENGIADKINKLRIYPKL